MGEVRVSCYPRYLVTDDIEEFFYKSACPRFRIRIWRGSIFDRNKGVLELTPMVMVSPVIEDDGSVSFPGRFTTKLGNYILEAYLKFPEQGMLYYEVDPAPQDTEPAIRQIFFEFYGARHRTRLYRPISRKITRAVFEDLVGGKVDF